MTDLSVHCHRVRPVAKFLLDRAGCRAEQLLLALPVEGRPGGADLRVGQEVAHDGFRQMGGEDFVRDGHDLERGAAGRVCFHNVGWVGLVPVLSDGRRWVWRCYFTS